MPDNKKLSSSSCSGWFVGIKGMTKTIITLLLHLTFSSLLAEVKALLVPSFTPFLLYVLVNKKALANSFCITRFTKIENPCNGQSCNHHFCNIAKAFPNFLFIPMLNVKAWRPELKVIHRVCVDSGSLQENLSQFHLELQEFCASIWTLSPHTLLMPSRLQIPFHFDLDIVPLTLNVLCQMYFK
eukprot:TRINITY_DN7824_c1_g1_i3.p1 TRINITY_DN7824_c1_g1~~TRINITY_DN7824_c1_g1_i3.p1  ORF type:complete len:184 (-),score=18.21 TRINITY_DN7824_c1_g1_i3:613-1164(-)